jgi:endonuclease-3 related protein
VEKKQELLHLSLEKDSFEIYTFLKGKELLKNSPHYWWPNAGTFEVVVGVILTQNTTWKNVEKSLLNLQGRLSLEHFVMLDEEVIKKKIHPSGFYNQKAPRLLRLALNIKNEFGTFKLFQKSVDRTWLLKQKGIGEESADAILCYACFRAEMVVDTYTKRLLKEFGIEFKNYGGYKEFLESSLQKQFSVEKLPLVYANFHGMIVEYNKLKKT